MAAQSNKRTKIFISYSHQDGDWLARLRIHLKPLEREHRIEIWDDTKIKPGSRWRQEIEDALSTAKVAVLLVSADFLASDFIATSELPLLLNAAEKEGAIILPLILSPSRFLRTTSLAQFQSVNDPLKPLIGLSRSEQETMLDRLIDAIEASMIDSPNLEIGQLQKDEAISSNECEGVKRSEPGSRLISKTRTERGKRLSDLSKIHPTIWVAAIGSIVALITAYWQVVYKPAHSVSNETISYRGRVIDAITRQAIKDSKVSVEAQGYPAIYYTDSDGAFYLKLGSSIEAVRIRVEADGYEPLDVNVSSLRTGIEDVGLQPKPTAPIISEPSPSKKNVQGVSTYLRQCEDLYKKRQYDAAIAQCDKALSIDPRNRRARDLKNKIIETRRILKGAK
jgi:hypothetical protein